MLLVMPGGWFNDTDPQVLEKMTELYRRMTPAERIRRVLELNELSEQLQRASVRAMYREASEREVFLRVAARRLDRETMIRAFGWDPDEHP